MGMPNEMGPTAEVISVVRLEVTEGRGVEGNPCRRVVYYFATDGTRLARVDGWEEGMRFAREATYAHPPQMPPVVA